MNIPRGKNSTLRPLLSCMMLMLLVACSDGLLQLERIKERGKLRVAIIAMPPLYFPDESLPQGYDYNIVAGYAESLGVELEIIQAKTLADIIALLKQGKAHIGVAGSVPSHPDHDIWLSSAYNKNEWYVIGNRKNKLPHNIAEVTPSTLIVAEGSGSALVLSRLKKNNAALYWFELPNGNTHQVIEQINADNFQLSVINADVYTLYRHVYPEIKIAFSLNKDYSSHWLVYKNKDTSLLESINAFIDLYKDKGKIQQQHNIYFSHLDIFNYLDALYYLKRIDSILPKYSADFKKAAIDNGFDERFLAAISYQESHWDEKARSHTGVRGLMMLTNETAKRVGVEDRLDPKQSIMGGAKYLNILRSSLPERIAEPDRSWMTLAAYNTGLGHLEDARIITKSLGDNPDLWVDVEKHLPKLAHKKWYEKTKHGYARGNEPVKFVDRIRRYYDILRLYQQEQVSEKQNPTTRLDKLQPGSPVL